MNVKPKEFLLRTSFLLSLKYIEFMWLNSSGTVLQTLAHTLQAMGQDEGMYQQYIPLALHLAEDHFLLHTSKDVQLLIACCIADVLRVYAPEAPYKDPEQVKVGSSCPLYSYVLLLFMAHNINIHSIVVSSFTQFV